MFIGIVFCIVSVTPCYGTVQGITSKNYLSYEKKYADTYGYNKGECNREYLPNEEFFYNDYYDHWNVDKVYDPSCITNKKLVVAYAKANYPNHKIQFITLNNGHKKLKNRKGKYIVYIEKCVTKSNGKGGGFTKKGHYYVAYNKKVKKGKKVTSYFVYNPKTNYVDDVVAVVDNKIIR